LHEVKQQPADDEVGFYARVISIFDELELLLPAAARRPVAVAMPAPIAELAGFGALAEPIRHIIPTIFDLGITTALNHVAIQLFVAGLKPSIKDEKHANSVMGCFSTGHYLGENPLPLKTNTPMVNEIADEQETLELDGEIEAVRDLQEISIPVSR
jgi:hypothetical protein